MWKDEHYKHHCDLPYHTPREELKKFWECPDCLAVFTWSISGWTGWWSADTSDSVRGVNKYGTPTIYCMYEKWVTCEPSITFTPFEKGMRKIEFSASSCCYPTDEADKPDWIRANEALPPRPLWAGKEIPGLTDNPPSGNLSRVASPGDTDLPEIPKAKKKRKWLLNG